MRILLTGAHFTPAVAVIEEFKKKPNIDIVYVGRKTTLEGDATKSVESNVLPLLGVKFIPIITGRLQRSFTIYTIPSLLKIPIGFMQAFWIILFSRPDVILSFGGYVGVPVVFAGWLFSIPIIIHEQTLVSGLANKISSFFADKIALSFDEGDPKNTKVAITGNPIRQSILEAGEGEKKKGKMPVILIMGGNQGSHVINLAVENCLSKLLKIAFVIHVSGDNKFKDFERLESLTGERYVVKKWIGQDYGQILSKADLVVCRAGINTLSELTFLGIPALVIPIPYLYQDEQSKNAKYFEKLGLVKILPQSKLNGKTLHKNVKKLLNDLTGLKKNADLAKRTLIPDAARRLVLETMLLAKQ